MGDSSEHVARFLKASDPDRYFATLIAPADSRAAMQALFAFSADVAGIRERAREPGPGEIRLQWWIDALEGKGHGAVRANPLADALLLAIERFALPTGPLVRLLAARRFDLYDDPMPDLSTFEGYAGETVSVLHQLAAMVLNDGREIEAGDAAGHLGVAHALVGHLRAMGYHASRGQLFLPMSVFAACGVSERDLLSGTVGEGVSMARRQLAEIARDHAEKAAAAIDGLPRHLRPGFAVAALLPARLKQLLAGRSPPYEEPPDRHDWQKIAKIAAWAIFHG